MLIYSFPLFLFYSFIVLNDHFLFLFTIRRDSAVRTLLPSLFTVGVSVFDKFAGRLELPVINCLSAPDADSQLWQSVPNKVAFSIVTAF